ncbi:hypothetical protein cypCar_00037343 [Cyprinus carpio]|nr:hypothetical protein cypCar_00037343 [Cyprinus carpio]
MSDTRRRVEVYDVKRSGRWEGPGHRACVLLGSGLAHGSVLLESRISPDTAYQKQQVRPAAFLQECVVLHKSKHSSDVTVRLSCDPAAQNQAYASES